MNRLYYLSHHIWWILLFIVFSIMGSLKYYTLHSSVMDLGVLMSYFYKISLTEVYGNVFIAHLHVVAPFFTWLLEIFPDKFSPFVLIVFQSLMLSLPVYWLHKQFGKVVSLSYVLFFPLWFNALFDFHIDHLVIPVLFYFFLAVRSGNLLLAIFLAISLSFIKEYFALQTAMCGVYLILSILDRGQSNVYIESNRKIFFYGLFLIIFGFGYFYIAINYFLPFFHDTTIINPISSFGWLGSSVGEILWYVLTNPIEVITNILSTHGKLTYILALFGVLGFISLLKPAPLVLALPIFAISLLSQYEGLYGLGHHYTAGLIPPIIIAFAFGLPRAKLIWRKAGFSDKLFYPVLIFGLILSHVILSPSPIGRLFWSDKIWSYNYRAYIPLERDEMIKTAIAKHIPTDPGVIISLQNTLNISSLVQPHYFHLFPDGVTEEQKVLFYNSEAIRKIEHEAKKADFVIIDLKRPWFIIDKGCSWLYGECTDGKVAKDYLYWVDESKKVMDIEFKNDGFMILRRKQ